MTGQTQTKQTKKQANGKFDQMLEAWRDGNDVAWSELMAAWVEAPTAPRSPETITRLIKHLNAK